MTQEQKRQLLDIQHSLIADMNAVSEVNDEVELKMENHLLNKTIDKLGEAIQLVQQLTA